MRQFKLWWTIPRFRPHTPLMLSLVLPWSYSAYLKWQSLINVDYKARFATLRTPMQEKTQICENAKLLPSPVVDSGRGEFISYKYWLILKADSKVVI